VSRDKLHDAWEAIGRAELKPIKVGRYEETAEQARRAACFDDLLRALVDLTIRCNKELADPDDVPEYVAAMGVIANAKGRT